MSRINEIEKSIVTLDGGKYQKLMDAYLYKKYQFSNIQPLGVQTATDKVTKGTPDSFVQMDDGKYILIMYGSVEAIPFEKMKSDILTCFEQDKLMLETEKIEKIICAYTSTNIHVEQIEELQKIIDGINVELIGIGTVSHDLLVKYPFLAAEFLNIPIDTEQIYDIDEFVRLYDKNGMNAPLDMEFFHRELDIQLLKEFVDSSKVTIVSGMSGVGKTKLVIETCKDYRKNGWKVLCVKNNGELLYNDLRFYISDEGKYILFIDDANLTTSLEYVMNYITNPPTNIEIKLIMTVRDYAKNRVRSVVCKSFLPSELQVKSLGNEEIKRILEHNLGIKNDYYLRQIIKIAKGNIRLAILAGKTSIEKGYVAINNATDIFKNYYGQIVNSQKISDKEVYVLFIISLFGPLRFKESKIALLMLENRGINDCEFTIICHNLNERELIDLYQDEVAKISDQSFGNYILEYVLVEKKSVSIRELMKLGFPQFRNKLIYALNTLIALFNSDEVRNYIENQVNSSWNDATDDLEFEYVKSFHALNEEKALSVIKKRIDEMNTVEMDLSEFDFNATKNGNSIKTEEIVILSSFKYSDYYVDAIQLMLSAFDRRPDLVMEFYFAFSDRMGFDLDSFESGYEKEKTMIKCLWEKSNNGEDVNCTLLLLHVLDVLLKYEFCKTEPGENNRSFNMVTFHLVCSEELKKLRGTIWKIMGNIYECNRYKELIEHIIISYNLHGNDNSEAGLIMLHDLECFKGIFLDKWGKLSFEQCSMVKKLQEQAKWLEITCDESFNRYNTNDEFNIYNILTKEHVKGRTWQEDEEDRRKSILELVEGYSQEDFSNMFKVCKDRELKKERNDWSLQSGIDCVFEILEKDASRYISAMEAYLNEDAPYGYNPSRKICTLFKILGVEKTELFINSIDFQYKRRWICEFFQLIPKDLVNNNITNKLLEFVNSESKDDEPIFPEVYYLEKFKVFNPEVVYKIGTIVAECAKSRKYLASIFLDRSLDEEKLDDLFRFFEDHIDLLEDLYILAVDGNFDYEGKLLLRMIDGNLNFWNRFTIEVNGNFGRTSYEHDVFQTIWNLNNYEELINIAYYNWIEAQGAYYVDDEVISIFANNEKTSQDVCSRKNLWIKKYISANYDDVQKMNGLFVMIATIFPGKRIEYIIEFLKYNKNSNDFEYIALFPNSESWSGSAIPLIENKIEFLEKMIEEMKGYEYIEHRSYLKQRLISYKDYKQSVLIKEYLENSDIA